MGADVASPYTSKPSKKSSWKATYYRCIRGLLGLCRRLTPRRLCQMVILSVTIFVVQKLWPLLAAHAESRRLIPQTNTTYRSRFQVHTLMDRIPERTHDEISRVDCPAVKGTDDSIEMNTTIGATIWLPAFPGSGSELMRDLIKALTGTPGADIHDTGCLRREGVNDGWHMVAPTCKTHWPVLQAGYPTSHKFDGFHSTILLLLRNPRTVIPSYCNFDFEYSAQAASHSMQAPKAAWQACRDNTFDRKMDNWAMFLNKWTSVIETRNFSADNKKPIEIKYIAYEDLIQPETGPTLVEIIAAELKRAGTSVTSELPLCIWRRVVRDKPRQKRLKSYEPSFTAKQRNYMVATIERITVATETKSSPTIPGVSSTERSSFALRQLDTLLKLYHDDIMANTPLEVAKRIG